MRVNIEIDNVTAENVEQFVYLGAIVSHTGGTNEDIRIRLEHTRTSDHKIRSIWNRSQVERKPNM